MRADQAAQTTTAPRQRPLGFPTQRGDIALTRRAMAETRRKFDGIARTTEADASGEGSALMVLGVCRDAGTDEQDGWPEG